MPRKKQEQTESAGDRLRRLILEDFELDAGELVLLERACELADTCARLDAEVAASPLTVPGSRGQLTSNPLLLQQRKASERLQRLIEGLRLPAKGEQVGVSRTSLQAQAAARARWARRKALGA